MKLALYYLRVFLSEVPNLSYVLSNKSLIRSLSLTAELWYFLISQKTFLKNQPRQFSFVYQNQAFTLALHSATDIAALIEIFVLREYDWNLAWSPKTILDLGAHWGDTAIYYSLELPEAKIYSLEPNPEIYARLEHTARQFKNITPVQGAFSSESGTHTFYISDNSLGNSLIRRTGTTGQITVRALTFEDICSIAGVAEFDLVKFDIEGAEKYIFNDPTLVTKAKAFIGEIHLDLTDITLADVEAYFSNFQVDIQKINQFRYIVKAVKVRGSSEI